MRRPRGGLNVSSAQFSRILYLLRILFTIMTWGFVALTFALAIHAATVTDDRVDKAKEELRAWMRKCKQKTPVYDMLAHPSDDDAFLKQYSLRCPLESENMQMNAPGGFTSAENCASIRDTLEWPVMTNVARNELCQSFRAYSASTPLSEGWGRCEYDAAIKGCKYVQTTATADDTAGCVDTTQQGAYELLQGSTTYPYSSRYATTRTVVVNNDAFSWLNT